MRTRILLFACLALLLYSEVDADAQVCGRVDGQTKAPTTTDALAALRASVGTFGACRLCLCDVDGDGAIGSDDALAILRKAVGVEATFTCAACACPIPQRLPVGQHPRVVRVADLDRDGKLDLVVAQDESRSVSTLMGTGEGSFAAPRDIEPGGAPMSVTVAAIDDDDIPDLVTANQDPSAVAILLGRGGGGFAPPRLLAAGDSPVNVAVGDLNGDENADLVAVNSLSNDLSVYLADGAGGFTERPRVGVGIGPRWVELADLTGDVKLDAVTANRDSHNVTILAGNGDGTFADGRAIHVCAGAHQAIPADLNRDGKLDLVVPCKAERALAVLIARGAGEFDEPRLYDTQATAIAAAVSDLDADGKLDVVVTCWYPHQVVFFRGGGDGGLAEGSRVNASAKVRGIALDDVTGDGVTDIVIASPGSNDLLLFPGTGQLSVRTQFEVVQFRPRVRDMATADFDADGSLDFVAVNWHALSAPYTHFPDYGARFAFGELIDIPRFPSAVITGDFNGDHKPDFVAKNNKVWAADPGKRCTDPHLAFFAGRGDLTFEPELRVAAANLSHHTDDDFAAADVDADGTDDLIIIERQSAAVTYMRGKPNGQFEVVQRIPVDTSAAHLVVSDFNADQAPDIAWVEGPQGRDVVVRLRDEHLRFGFAANATIHLGAPASWLVAGDIDGDGRGDLVTGAASSTLVETHLAQADGPFSAPVRSNVGLEFFQAPELIDADVDRDLDLVGLHADRPVDPILPLGAAPMIAAGTRGGLFGRARIIDPGDVVPELRRFATTALLAANVDADPALDFVVAYNGGKERTRGIILYNVGHCLDSPVKP